MRISWLTPSTVATVRAALLAHAADWSALFAPDFVPPPPPPDELGELDAGDWVRIAEHVARAERVAMVVREDGLAEARVRFGDSDHAVELAALIAATLEAEEVSLPLVEALLELPIDELVVYGNFLSLLVQLSGDAWDAMVARYEQFVAAAQASTARDAEWPERVRAVRDGLASLYVRAGRHDDGHHLFSTRHDEDRGDIAVALSASRAFLAAGEVARAVHWLGLGAERAQELGRMEMHKLLTGKQETLRRRLN